VFAAAEIAIVSLRQSKLQELVQQGKAGAQALSRLRARPEQFLATVQIGITVVSAAAAAYGGDQLPEMLTPVLQPWLEGVPVIGDSADDISFGIVVAGIAYLSLVLGELVPKSLALRSSQRYALVVGGPRGRWCGS
jgi:putative hemolysin